jgi:transposase-like protein
MSDQPGVSTKQRRTSAEVKQIVAGFASSGLTKVEFCRREQISSSTLYRNFQQAKETSTATAQAGLIAVEVIGSRLGRDGDGGLSVVLRHGRRIEVGAGFDGATLQRLILVLERM